MVAGAESSGFLLDSNVIVAAFEEEAGVLDRLWLTPSAQIFIPAIAVGELYFGALKSRRTSANLERLMEFAAASNVLSVDETVARFYGRVRDRLRRIG